MSCEQLISSRYLLKKSLRSSWFLTLIVSLRVNVEVLDLSVDFVDAFYRELLEEPIRDDVALILQQLL